MASFVSVESFFSHVYVVDLSPSLCEVARQRFARLGWKNVTVVCQDAREFRIPDIDVDNNAPSSRKADLVTMSYSLSMIPGRFMSLIYILSVSEHQLTRPHQITIVQ